jgi:hypothetical protein
MLKRRRRTLLRCRTLNALCGTRFYQMFLASAWIGAKNGAKAARNRDGTALRYPTAYAAADRRQQAPARMVLSEACGGLFNCTEIVASMPKGSLSRRRSARLCH